MSSAAPATMAFRPAYLALLESGELARRVELAYRHLEDRDLCARYCHDNRRQTLKGAVCRTGELARVHSAGSHHGEEDPRRGWRGSGTLFCSGCSLRGVFCQNRESSQKGIGHEVMPQERVEIMLDLPQQGCHNINFVTPSHGVAQIIAAVPQNREDETVPTGRHAIVAASAGSNARRHDSRPGADFGNAPSKQQAPLALAWRDRHEATDDEKEEGPDSECRRL